MYDSTCNESLFLEMWSYVFFPPIIPSYRDKLTVWSYVYLIMKAGSHLPDILY